MNDEGRAAVDPAQWKVLLVDDEPAVHDVSRLILGGLTFEGIGVDLISAHSASQARELLTCHPDVALVLLDVVMETDDAGLRLVEHIREQLRYADMQIVLRTGQPGMAPERDVVLRYEINGYNLKTDITAQRLHSIVISALRNYRYSRSLRAMLERDVQLVTPQERDATRMALATELAQTDDGDSVLMRARPQIALASNHVAGIELVPQWRTSLGLLPADQVCATLGDGPVRRRIVRWLLAQASSWAASWRAISGRTVFVSIPLIGESLGDCETFATVLDAVRGAALPPGTLDLLVGEATLLNGHPDMREAVDTLRAAGLTFTLTDFGAQMLSLQRLNQLVPDRVKIHRLFVSGVAKDSERKALARSLIALAQTLSIVAVADGITSDSDAQFFRWEGCDLGQGDALAAACSPADVGALLHYEKRALN
jgi:EAL domain-containing protein (putative c-di-GMP-specific phosphodiesterase class I)/CheY-like chemotaxis protein